MSIETEINRISTNVSGTLSAISEMGGEVPENATSDDMASGVRSIPVGAKIDDTTPSSTTTYSSQKIESELTALNEANALQDTEIAKKANADDLAVVAKSGSYNDLNNKPTIPTVPSALPNPNALTFTGAVNETYDGSAAKSVSIPTIPESLKNPNKLILSGAVTAEYDGSAPVSVEIPAGGPGSYTLPVASPTTLGGVMPAAKTDKMTQAVGVDDAGRLWAMAGIGSSGGADGVWTLYHDITVEEAVNSLSGQIDSSCREILIYMKTAYDENVSKYLGVYFNEARVYEEIINRNSVRNNFFHIVLSPECDFLYVVGACSYTGSAYMANAKAGLQNVGIVGNISSLSGPYTIALSNYGNAGENGTVFTAGSRLKIWGR